MWKPNQQWRRPYLNQNHNFRTQMWDFHIRMKFLQPHQLQSTNNLNHQSLHWTSTRKTKQPDRFGEPIPKNLLKKEGHCDVFKETSRNLEVFFIKVSKNKRRTYLTNFVAISISNGHKTKLNSNFVLALSWSYWPINHMSKVNSPTNGNLILTSILLQLMNLIAPRPYAILLKCWWKLKITSGIRNKDIFTCQSSKIFLANLNFLCIFSHRLLLQIRANFSIFSVPNLN